MRVVGVSQGRLLGDGSLGDRQAARYCVVRQAALVLESEYVWLATITKSGALTHQNCYPC